MTAAEIRKKLKALSSPEAARGAARFFKTGPGEYGEGDRFIGVNVPTLRTVSRAYRHLPLAEIASLLQSPIHEERHVALMILVLQATKADAAQRKIAFEFYLRHTPHINNWDLVDCSAPEIVGGYLFDRSRRPLLPLAKSKSLWERRIAVVATQYFIRRDDFGDTLTMSRMLLKDREDLIHKAAGWMLREVGKKNQRVLEGFLDQHAATMPRTMLRYAIERFTPDRRRMYLNSKNAE